MHVPLATVASIISLAFQRRVALEKPIFDYEKMIIDNLHSTKHLWIKKATGLGISELLLRYMGWLCVKDDALRGSQMCIVTGPRIDLAITLIDRMKRLFKETTLEFDTRETVIELNGVHIEAYPSHHLDSMSGLPNVSFILLDEATSFHQDSNRMQEMFPRGTLQSRILG